MNPEDITTIEKNKEIETPLNKEDPKTEETSEKLIEEITKTTKSINKHAPFVFKSEEREKSDAVDFSTVRDLIDTELGKRSGTPSIAVGVARNGKIIWAEGFGLANVEEEIKATGWDRSDYS